MTSKKETKMSGELILSRKAVIMMKDIHYIAQDDSEFALCGTRFFPHIDKVVPLMVKGVPRTITCIRCEEALGNYDTVKIARVTKGNGKDSQHLSGIGPPFSSMGKDGDFYLNKRTGYRYRKICAAWVLIEYGD